MTDKGFAGLGKLHNIAIAHFGGGARSGAFLVESMADLVETFCSLRSVNHSLTMLAQLSKSVVTGELVP
jgi:hypothetical protein